MRGVSSARGRYREGGRMSDYDGVPIRKLADGPEPKPTHNVTSGRIRRSQRIAKLKALRRHHDKKRRKRKRGRQRKR